MYSLVRARLDLKLSLYLNGYGIFERDFKLHLKTVVGFIFFFMWLFWLNISNRYVRSSLVYGSSLPVSEACSTAFPVWS